MAGRTMILNGVTSDKNQVFGENNDSKWDATPRKLLEKKDKKAWIREKYLTTCFDFFYHVLTIVLTIIFADINTI
ncbi:MAG: hypothetical protein GF308_08175 [Candidatus Heimdallarchaeota archaeon]|nr:hypothetical protein [Candidatus Heimdallarchaeota archaeon]